VAGEVHVERHLLRSREVLIARGAFGPLFADYMEHSRRWVGDPAGLVLALMRDGLAAAGLYSTFRALDQHTAWTINLAEPPLNVFLTADSSAGTVAGRYFLEHVATVDHNRIFVQSVRNIGQPQRSSVEVKGIAMLSIFEQYFARSEQWPARFFALENDTYFMLSALPGVDPAWISAVTRDDLPALYEAPDLRVLEARIVTFACSCDERRVHQVVRALFEDRGEELFQGEERVEVQCPRCGHSYWMTRADFAGPPPGDASAGGPESD
jgi:molecular chaperone Hsp33